MRTLNRLRNRHHPHTEPDEWQTIAVGVRHDRYTVAFQLDTCQMWVLDTTGRDTVHGPHLSSRQAWMVANELNTNLRPGERAMSARRAGAGWRVPEGTPPTVRKLRDGQLFESCGRVVGQRDGFVLVSWDDGGPMSTEPAADLTWPSDTDASATPTGHAVGDDAGAEEGQQR